MIMVREAGDAAPDVVEYRHGLTPPMRDARKAEILQGPELVQRVLKDLVKIHAGAAAENVDAEAAEQEEDVDGSVRNASKKLVPAPVVKADAPEVGTNAGEPDKSDSDESDDSI
ncbi:transcription initiation factor TFIID subunit 7-like [Corylus avellana]|uniref:transcription initiation factor TFIID subunit 7-like n=1 Tax=Corylus avellana TaxID=13451 RepID=UPI00286D1C43|nr:transcription initiation factor TFIID subunit 7-like [Corylus avellana]